MSNLQQYLFPKQYHNGLENMKLKTSNMFYRLNSFGRCDETVFESRPVGGEIHSCKNCTRFLPKQKDFEGFSHKTIGFRPNVYEIFKERFALGPLQYKKSATKIFKNSLISDREINTFGHPGRK